MESERALQLAGVLFGQAVRIQPKWFEVGILGVLYDEIDGMAWQCKTVVGPNVYQRAAVKRA